MRSLFYRPSLSSTLDPVPEHRIAIPLETNHPQKQPLLRRPPPKFRDPKIVRFWETTRVNFNFIFLTCLAITVANIFSETVKDVLRTNFPRLRDRCLVVAVIVVFFVLWATIVSLRGASSSPPPPPTLPPHSPSSPPPTHSTMHTPQNEPSMFGRV